MALDAGTWDDLYQVNIDLSDVVGTPGLASGDLVARLVDAVGGQAHDEGIQGAPFVIGEALGDEGPARLAASGFLGEDEIAAIASAEPLVNLTSMTGNHVVVQQRVRGAELIGARYRVHYQTGDTHYSVTGRPTGDVAERDPGEAPVTPTEADAIAAARERFRLAPETPVNVERVVFPVEGAAIWAWQVRAVLQEPLANLRAFLNASDLSLLLSYNIASASLYGEAQVYPVNPRRTATLRPAALLRLGPQPPDALRGQGLEVRPDRGDPITSPLRDCRLNPDDPGFDEVQAWYHLTRGMDWFRGLLGGTLLDEKPFRPLVAVVRDGTSRNNAYFVPDWGQLRFGDFGPRPTARSADIVIHELGHAISDSICRLGRSEERNTPARGLSEGYSDYFAASWFDDPRIGDYLADNDEGARNLSRPDLRFSTLGKTVEHKTGEVWGGMLWRVRTALGAEITDILAMESLQRLSPQHTWQEASQALLEVDRILFPADSEKGRHSDVIGQEFANAQ